MHVRAVELWCHVHLSSITKVRLAANAYWPCHCTNVHVTGFEVDEMNNALRKAAQAPRHCLGDGTCRTLKNFATLCSALMFVPLPTPPRLQPCVTASCTVLVLIADRDDTHHR
jgi:hypothetical protein